MINNPIFISELEGLSKNELTQIHTNENIEFDKEFQKNKKVVLDSLNETEYDEYKKIATFGVRDYPLKDTLYIHFFELWDKLNSKKGDIEKYLEKVNITKNDKLLIMCYDGQNSQIISYFLCKRGYNAYYGSYYEVNNKNFIDSDIFKESIKERSIIVDSLNYNLDEKYYLFLFDIHEEECIDSFHSLMEEKGLKKNIYSIKGTIESERLMKIKYPEMMIVDIKEIDLKKSKFICLNELHCLLTKHKIDVLNLEVKKIYLPDLY